MGNSGYLDTCPWHVFYHQPVRQDTSTGSWIINLKLFDMTAFIVGLIIFILLGMIAFCTFMALKERDDARLSAPGGKNAENV